MRRSTFLAISIVTPVLWLLVATAVSYAIAGGWDYLDPNDFPLPAFVGSFLLVVWISLVAQIKRWHDREKSGLWVLINFVPLIGGIWALVENLLGGPIPGRSQSNAYGDDPRTSSGIFVSFASIIGALALILGFARVTDEFDFLSKTAEAGATSIRSIPVPEFPNIELHQPVPGGIQVGQIRLEGSPEAEKIPGWNMQFRVYLPPGEHPPGSLACVLNAPAGTNLLHGSDLGELNSDAYHDETLPYAKAGMAVVQFSIDGNRAAESSASNDDANAQFIRAYHEFRDARAGVINGRNALEFVLAKLPMVDPQRIFVAGHSSAGTLALLLAAHEPRLRGCVAYAPCSDVKALHGEIASEPGVSLVLTGFGKFLHSSSPINHAEQLDLPVFLFQAEDDGIVSFEDTKAFYLALKKADQDSGTESSDVVFSTVSTGGHYESMIDPGIPRAIEWMQRFR